MSSSDTTDQAIQRVRDAFRTAADQANEMSEKPRKEVEGAIDDLEECIGELRD